MLGPGAEISAYLTNLEKLGVKVPPRIFQYENRKNPTKPEYVKAVELLRNTILTAPEIESITGVSQSIVSNLSRVNKCRTKIIGNAIKNGKGLRIEKIPWRFSKLPSTRKNEIIEGNRQVIESMVRSFPIQTEHTELRKHVMDYVGRGLDNYSEELGTEKHVVLLLATRAIYDYKLKTITVVNIPRLRIAREISYEQRAKEIEEVSPMIHQYAKRRIRNNEDAEDVGQNAVLTCFYSLDSFNPRIHKNLHAFARSITDHVMNIYYREKLEERKRIGILRGEALVDQPHIKNRPKVTRHTGDKGKRFGE